MRYSTKQAGGGSGGSSSLAALNTTVTTAEAVLVGDVLTMNSDDSKVYYALPPNSAGSAQRPMVTTAAANNVSVSSTVLGTSPAAGQMAACQLVNGNIAVLQAATTTNYPTLAIYDQTGTVVVAPFTVEAVAANGATLDICALAGGNLALVYCASTTTPKRAIYDPTGVQVLAPTNIEVTTGVASLMVSPLSTGEFVVGYHKTVAAIRQPHFARYNAAGALQGAITQADTTCNSDKPRAAGAISIAGLTGGGFVVAYACNVAATNAAPRFARYNAAGVLQGATTQHAGVIGSGIEQGVHCVGLTDGGFAICNWFLNGNSGNMKGQKYDAAGATVGAGSTYSFANSSGEAHQTGRLVAVPGGGYSCVVANHGDNLFLSHRCAGDGTISGAGSSAGGGPIAGYYDPITNETVFVVNSTGGGGADVGIRRMNVTTLVQTPSSGVGTAAKNVFAFGLQNPIQPLSRNFGVLYGAPTQQTTLQIWTQRVPVMTPIGVAAASAAANAAVPAQITGAANVRLPFALPYANNAQGNTVPGQKMSVVGNTAILQGIQA